MGGILLLLQLVLDRWNMHDWNGILGNPSKLGSSLLTIGFDVRCTMFAIEFYSHVIL